jgi:tetratricopeptide (TPR) repeat protein
MAYDMIPEMLGADVPNMPMWKEKHIGIQHAKFFIAISNNTAKDLRHFSPNIAANQITVAHTGVDFKAPGTDVVLNFRKTYQIDRPYFLLVGARDGYKNTVLFFKAFAALGAAGARYGIVCTGPVAVLEPQHAALADGAKIYMLNLSDAELQCAYAGAQALVYPSLYEGFGMPILEAMACACPVITTRNGSIPEVAADAAMYVGGADVSEMVRALKNIQKVPVRKRLVELGLKRAAGFSWKKMAELVKETIERTALEASAAWLGHAAQGAAVVKKYREDALGAALSFHQAGQLAQADTIYQKLLDLNVNDFVALHLHGVVMHQQGDFGQAEVFLLRALAVNSITPEVHHNLGNLYLAQGRINESWACYSKAVALNPQYAPSKNQLDALNSARG